MVPNRNYLAMEALVEELVRSGVRDACLSPGNRSAPLAFALARARGIRVWTHVDERSSGFFALGLARKTRRPVVVACTSGSAVANLMPAVVEAHYGRVGLIMLTADRPPELLGRSAPQTIEQRGIFGPHVRFSADLGPPDPSLAGLRHIRSTATRAVAEAAGPPAGVSHLNLPLRDPLDPISLEDLDTELLASRGAKPHTSFLAGSRRVGAESLHGVLSVLEGAERPVVFAGSLDDGRPDLAEAVLELAIGLGAPVLAEPMSNLRGETLEPVRVDAYEALLRAGRFTGADAPDVVVRLGGPPTSRTVAEWLEASGAANIVIDDGLEWPDPASSAAVMIRAELEGTCRSLALGLRGGDAPEAWRRRWLEADGVARASISAFLESEREGFEGNTVAAVAQAIPAQSTLYVASSMAVRDLDWFWPRGKTGVRILANRGANGIDGFVSSVLGAASAGGPVVGLCGDLSFFHDVSGLVAGRRLGLQACFVVNNNGGGGIFDFLPTARGPEGWSEHYEKLFVTPLGIDLGPLAKAYGASFETVGEPTGIAAAVSRGIAAPGISVVEVVLDRKHAREAHARCWQAVRDGLEGN
jgi:2-succinyl-5-enolpyruvyl-6-hydroxy-3-cyclohexene-1-carboxylate synthase